MVFSDTRCLLARVAAEKLSKQPAARIPRWRFSSRMSGAFESSGEIEALGSIKSVVGRTSLRVRSPREFAIDSKSESESMQSISIIRWTRACYCVLG